MELKRVAIFGSSLPRPGTSEYMLAYDIGRCVAGYGLELINGGYSGTMEASAKGAVESGGRTIGVTVQTFDYAQPNPYLTENIWTSDLLQRLTTLISLGDFYVILPGGTGTLLELSLVWEFCNKRLSTKPIFIHAFWKNLLSILPHETHQVTLAERDERFNKIPMFCDDLPAVLDSFLKNHCLV